MFDVNLVFCLDQIFIVDCRVDFFELVSGLLDPIDEVKSKVFDVCAVIVV